MIRNPRLRRRAFIILAAGVTATQACGDDGNTVAPPTPSIILSISESSATREQGESVTIRATLTGSGGYNGAGAAFALTGVPVGVTFAISNQQTAGSVTTATVVAYVGSTVAPGSYTLNVIGSGLGVEPASAPFTLIVPPPAITLTISPASAEVGRGQSVAIATTLTNSGGYRGAGAAFTMTGAPAGVTFAVSNIRPNGLFTTAMITTAVAATVPIGTYNLTITGSGIGVGPSSVPFRLTVVPENFTLSVNPAALTADSHAPPATATITINRINGFAGSVELFASINVVGDEQGGRTTATLDPISTTGNSSKLTVNTSVAEGNYTLTIIGAAPGSALQTLAVPLKIISSNRVERRP